MFENEARVLIVVPRDLVDRARLLAARATIAMKLPVSLQIVLRALIDEGLKRSGDAALMANMSRQATAVRRIRSEARRRSVRRASSPHASGRRGSAPRA